MKTYPIPSTAPIRFWERNSHHAQLAHLRHDVIREFSSFLHLFSSWGNNFVSEFSGHVTYHLLFVRKIKIHSLPPSPCRHPQGSIEPDRRSIQHRVLKNLLHEQGKLWRSPETFWKGNGSLQSFQGFLGQGIGQGSQKQTRSNRYNPDSIIGELPGDRQGHANHPSLGGTIGSLSNLAFESGTRRGVDDHPLLTICVGRVQDHLFGTETNHVEGPDEIEMHDKIKTVHGDRKSTRLNSS